jgi:hypothetical protein
MHRVTGTSDCRRFLSLAGVLASGAPQRRDDARHRRFRRLREGPDPRIAAFPAQPSSTTNAGPTGSYFRDGWLARSAGRFRGQPIDDGQTWTLHNLDEEFLGRPPPSHNGRPGKLAELVPKPSIAAAWKNSVYPLDNPDASMGKRSDAPRWSARGSPTCRGISHGEAQTAHRNDVSPMVSNCVAFRHPAPRFDQGRDDQAFSGRVVTSSQASCAYVEAGRHARSLQTAFGPPPTSNLPPVDLPDGKA